jgi:uncharacterized protein (DUF924 family)
MPSPVSPREISNIVDFWVEAGPEAWFRKDETFDQVFRQRYESLHFAAARRELDDWAESAQGVLALMILLDQFPRNAYRNTGHMFATDSLALSFVRTALDKKLDAQLDTPLQLFYYLPFCHSENLADQERCVQLYASLPEPYMPHAIEHLNVIKQFGRFPHRNRLLGRESTPQELEFLKNGGFAG